MAATCRVSRLLLSQVLRAGAWWRRAPSAQVQTQTNGRMGLGLCVLGEGGGRTQREGVLSTENSWQGLCVQW